jgi:adenosine kinase
MNQPYKVAVLGPIPFDHITTSKGKEIIKYGCVTHPAIALSRLLEGIGTVHPVTHIRKQDEDAVKQLLGTYPNMGLEAISSDLDQGDVIELRFVDQNNRLEKQTAFMPPIRPVDVNVVIDSDVFVCVPISDYEVPLETLQYIKENRREDAITIFDAHGPTTVVTTTGDRLRRFWIERDQWLPYIDVLKMNIEEAGCCWFKKEYNEQELKSEYQELTEAEMEAFARYVIAKGVKSVFITLDERGCMVYRENNGEFDATFVHSVPVSHVIDTTGCGDSFAGGMAFGLLDNRTDYVKAAQYANALGALRTQGTTFEVFKSLEDTDQLIRGAYKSDARV